MDQQMIVIVFILPGLFALTLVVEGLHNVLRASNVRLPELLRRESGWVNLALGILFFTISILAYIYISTR